MQKILLLLLLSPFSLMYAQTCDLDFEDWENASNSNPPTGWQNINSYVGNISGSSYSGANYGGMNTQGDQWIVEPLSCPGEICFYWRASGSSSDYDVDIDWSSDSGSTWTTAHSISLNGSNSPTTYSQLCVDLPEVNYTTSFTNILVRFNMSRRAGGSFYFDDVCTSGGVCNITPTQLTFSNLQSGCLQKDNPFSVTVCATDANGNVDNSFTGSISLSGSNLSGTTSQAATAGCSQFTNLQINTAGTYTLNSTDGTLSGTSSPINIVNLCATTSDLKVMAYNLLNFPNGRDDCGASNTVVPARWDTLRTILDYAMPDVLMVCELQTEAGADLILSNALNIGGSNNFARANFVLNQSPGGTSLNNAFFYNTTKMTLYAQEEIATNVRDIGKYTVFMNDPNLAAHQDTVFIDFYTAHFKAGNSAADVASREIQCNTLQNHLNNLTANRNSVVGGDFNFYTSSEAGYQTLLSGNDPFFDPISTSGSWDNNGSFSSVHTQSTRPSGSDQLDCGATGGLDSRFDFLLNSGSIMNGNMNVSYIAGSYGSLGNSGNLFNDAINDPANNSGVPAAVLSALRHNSDHLPILMNLEVTFPAVPLPFDLLYFTAKQANETAILEWEITDTEEDLDYFTVQISEDRRRFIDVTTIDKSEATVYNFSEKLKSGTSFYRLKSTEIDGTTSYSPMRALTREGPNWQLYPNPVRTTLTIKIHPSHANHLMNIQIYDALGRSIYHKKNVLNNTLEIDTKNWKSGIYTVEMTSGNQRFVKRVVK